MISLGDFHQMAPVKVLYMFKDDDKDYGLLTINLWADHLCIYSLTEIM